VMSNLCVAMLFNFVFSVSEGDLVMMPENVEFGALACCPVQRAMSHSKFSKVKMKVKLVTSHVLEGFCAVQMTAPSVVAGAFCGLLWIIRIFASVSAVFSLHDIVRCA